MKIIITHQLITVTNQSIRTYCIGIARCSDIEEYEYLEFLIVGGYDEDEQKHSDNILQFQKENNTFIIIGRLLQGRYDHSMSIVSVNDYACANQSRKMTTYWWLLDDYSSPMINSVFWILKINQFILFCAKLSTDTECKMPTMTKSEVMF